MHAAKIDASSLWGRRFHELFVDTVNDRGGYDLQSELER